MTNEALARDLATKNGYSGVERLGEWRGYDCYEPHMDGDQPLCIGLPLMVMVLDGEARMSTAAEAMESIDAFDDESAYH